VGPTAHLDAVEKRKICCLSQGSNSDSTVVESVVIVSMPTELSRLLDAIRLCLNILCTSFVRKNPIVRRS
jgi:hypothetical protein